MNLKIPLSIVCLNFAILNKFIDKVIVGVDNIENLKEIIRSPEYLSDVENVFDELNSFKEEDENIILPFKWDLSKATIH